MEQQGASRRAFVGGAAASVALIGAIAFAQRASFPRQPEDADGITVVPGVTPAYQPVAHEFDHWTAAVGQPIQIAAEGGNAAGSVLSVVSSPSRSRRPAGLRRKSFIVYLAMELRGAPLGNRIYTMAAPIAGLRDVFLIRGSDVGGKAILMAVFN